MKYRLDVRPQALSELSEALMFYRGRSLIAGEKFNATVASTFEFIREFPWASDRINESIRRCNLGRFPYTLIYAIEKRADDLTEIVVISCVHQHNNPDDWPVSG